MPSQVRCFASGHFAEPSAFDTISERIVDAFICVVDFTMPLPANSLTGKRIAFTGRLAGMTRREARQLLTQRGAEVVDVSDGLLDFLVVGEDELPLEELEPALDATAQSAVRRGELTVLTETQLWQRLDLIEAEQNVHPLYTAATLAQLLGISVAAVRRWQRLGLIVPVREVRRLAYFDFQQVVTARSLARLVAAGVPVARIERQLRELRQFLPEIERPLAQLSILADGKKLLLRKEGGLLDATGQMRFDFDAAGDDSPDVLSANAVETGGELEHDADWELGGQSPSEHVERRRQPVSLANSASPNVEEMRQFAAECEDEGELDQAVEWYRAILAAVGPHAETCFQLADALYRLGDLTASRERYYMTLEIDEEFIEARANLGCVLLELNQPELAEAAFRGALASHPDYADVHYLLARMLTRLNRPDDAISHWRDFLRLSPRSPWADEAKQALAESGHAEL